MVRIFSIAIFVGLSALAPHDSDAQTPERMFFEYQFHGVPSQPWSVGAQLQGEIMGYIDPTDPNSDRVIITEFLGAWLLRPGLPIYFYEVENAEFNSISAAGALEPPTDPATMSFSGTDNNFRYCQRGFVLPVGNEVDCGFGAPGEGGFGYSENVFPGSGGWVSAADGDTPLGTCIEPRPGHPDGDRDWNGCRVTDVPFDPARWALTRRDPDLDGVLFEDDSCPGVFNPGQEDLDGNGRGDACEIGMVQDFGDGDTALIDNAGGCLACLVNGWGFGPSEANAGDGGAGDAALLYDANGGGFHALTWEGYDTADFAFLGDFTANGVTAVSFKARHTGTGPSLALRAFIFDTFNDGTTDGLISNSWADISNTPPGTSWNTYVIPIDLSTDLTPWAGNTNSANAIMSGVAQFGLRHDPGGEGPGSPDRVTSIVYLDDIQLIINPDLDGDGIHDDIDTSPGLASSGFDDGTTSGTITDPGDQQLLVTDEPAPDGVRIAADAGGGPGGASVSVCSGAATLSFNASDESVVTCTSVKVVVVAGILEMVVQINGEPAVVTVEQNNEITFIPETSSLIAPPSNPDPVVLEIGGAEVVIEPGENVDFVGFASFSASVESDDDETEIEGNFKLGSETDGIKPHKEDVTVTIGGHALTIPAGGFEKDDGEWEFEGNVNGVDLEVEIERIQGKNYALEFEADSDLGVASGPIDLTLLIGNDTGSISVIPADD